MGTPHMPFWRVGEAINPGPSVTPAPVLRRVNHPEGVAVTYPQPHRQGFRDVIAPGHVRDPTQDRRDEQFELLVESANVTGWEALKKRLLATEAHVLLAQETWVLQAYQSAASTWAINHGWKSIWAPATHGPNGGAAAGVAIFARSYLGLRYPTHGPHVWHEAHAVAAVLEAPSFRPMILASVYLHNGQGPSRQNLEVLADVGAGFRSQGEGWQLVAGGDYNMDPEDLLTTGLDRELRTTLMCPPTERGTFRTAKAASTIDYYLVTDALAAAVAAVSTVEATNVRGHVPVALRFKPRATALKALHLRKPPPLAVERVVGPLQQPPSADAAIAAAEAAVSAARADDSDIQEVMDAAYKAWADHAEQELVMFSGESVKKVGERGKLPCFVWRSVVPERAPPQAYPTTSALTWLKGITGELIRIGKVATTMRDDGPEGDHDAAHVRDLGADAAPVRRRDESADDQRAQHGEGEGPQRERQDARSRRPPTDIGTCHAIVSEVAESLVRDVPGGQATDEVARHLDAVSGLVGIMRDALTDPNDPTCGRTAWCQVPLAVISLAGAAATDIRDRLDDDIKKSIAKGRVQDATDWKTWVNVGVDAGASRAHAYSRLPTGWTPEMVRNAGGDLVSAPDDLLQAQRDKYKRVWRPADAPFRYRWGPADELPRMKPEELRDSAKSFAWKTTQTFDGYHPRQLANLSDPSLTALSALLQAVEISGIWPRQISLVVTALLPKPRGGLRPIGIAAAVYRLWAKTRRKISDRWEQAHQRAYFSAARGNGPVDTMWRLAARQEEGTADGLEALVAGEDIQSFFEVLDRGRLAEEARAVGYPIPLLRAAMAAYSAARVLTLQGRIARELYPTTGIIAGCSLAMALTKVYCLRAFDAFAADLPPSISFDAHVDDLTLGATGHPNAIIDDIVTAHANMKHMVVNELGCNFAQGKTSIVSSARVVAAALTRKLEVTGGVSGSACLLGIDCTAGAPRGRIGAGSKKAERLKAALARRKRLGNLRAAIGHRAVRVFRSGAQPAATFDAAVWGLADTEVRAIRKLAATTMSPKGRGRSMAMTHLWHRMPTAAAEHAPVLQMARMVWKAVTTRADAERRGSAITDLRRIHEAAAVYFQPIVEEYKAAMSDSYAVPAGTARRAWAKVRGPMAAAALTLARIGWEFRSPFELADERGAITTLTRTSPALLADLLHASLTRATERAVATSWASADPSFRGRRVCTDLAMTMARAGRKYTPLQAARFRSVVCGALVTKQRAKDRGYDTDGLCPLCAKAPDTERHRVYGCEATEPKVRAVVPDWFWNEAQRAAVADKFWITACFPHPADRAPPPASDDRCEVERLRPADPAEALMDVGGHAYIDGSSTAHSIRDLSRAACAIVETDGRGDPIKVLQMAVPHHMPQTSQASEYWGMALLHRAVGRPTDACGDCLNVTRAASGEAKNALSPQRKYAGLVLGMHADPDKRRLIRSIRWVKAHRTATGREEEDDARDLRGNAAADAAAREAVSLHPPLGSEVEAEVAYRERRAPLVVAAVTAAMELFPKADRGMARLPRPADEEQARDRRCHFWRHSAGAWRCTLCHAYTTLKEVPAYRRRQRCSGRQPHDEAALYSSMGHRVCKAEAHLPFVFCSRCGAWGNKRVKHLKSPCNQPTAAGRQALRRIEGGWHPLLQKDCNGNDRPRMAARVTAAYDSATGQWVDLATDVAAAAPADDTRAGHAAHPPPLAADAAMTDAPLRAELALDADDALADDAPMDAVDEEPDWSEEDVFGHGGGLDEAQDGPARASARLDQSVTADDEGGRSSKRAAGSITAPAATRRRIQGRDGVSAPRDFTWDLVQRLGSTLRRAPTNAAGRMEDLRQRVREKRKRHDVPAQAATQHSSGEAEEDRDGDGGRRRHRGCHGAAHHDPRRPEHHDNVQGPTVDRLRRRVNGDAPADVAQSSGVARPQHGGGGPVLGEPPPEIVVSDPHVGPSATDRFPNPVGANTFRSKGRVRGGSLADAAAAGASPPPAATPTPSPRTWPAGARAADGTVDAAATACRREHRGSPGAVHDMRKDQQQQHQPWTLEPSGGATTRDALHGHGGARHGRRVEGAHADGEGDDGAPVVTSRAQLLRILSGQCMAAEAATGTQAYCGHDHGLGGDSADDHDVGGQGCQLYSAAAGATPAVSGFVGQESIASTADRPADLPSAPSGGEAAPHPHKRRRLRGKQLPPRDADIHQPRNSDSFGLPRALGLPAAGGSYAAPRAAAQPRHAAAAHGRPPERLRRGPPRGPHH